MLDTAPVSHATSACLGFQSKLFLLHGVLDRFNKRDYFMRNGAVIFNFPV